jgi:hypothetical protein
MDAVSRTGGGQRQAWRRRTERDQSSVAARDADRAVAWSRQLNQAYAALRRQLHGVQADLDSAQAGSELLAHCLAFCSVLSVHHQGEDAGLFAELLRVRPDLGAVVRKLAPPVPEKLAESRAWVAAQVATAIDETVASTGAAAPESSSARPTSPASAIRSVESAATPATPRAPTIRRHRGPGVCTGRGRPRARPGGRTGASWSLPPRRRRIQPVISSVSSGNFGVSVTVRPR